MSFQQHKSGLEVLLEMLTYQRPGGGKTEEEFISTYLRPLDPWEDDYGNLWVKVGVSPILWSSHTDTVHHHDGRQLLKTKGAFIEAVVGKKRELSNCLGADCTTGVWLMREMILAGVSGLYVFHREEESGGMGSRFIAQHHADKLSEVKFAIALDRKGYDSVITHQGSRTCSDAFAKSMAAILGGDFKPDPTGTFTDTANYTSIIPECTNLSIGYFNQHGPKESQNLEFAEHMRNVLCTADFTSLVAERDPAAVEEEDDWDFKWISKNKGSYIGDHLDDPLEDFVYRRSKLVAEFLKSNGVSLDDLKEFEEFGG